MLSNVWSIATESRETLLKMPRWRSVPSQNGNVSVDVFAICGPCHPRRQSFRRSLREGQRPSPTTVGVVLWEYWTRSKRRAGDEHHAVLLIPANLRLFAVTFGFGRLLLHTGVADDRFGLRVTRVTLNALGGPEGHAFEVERLFAGC